MIFAGTPDVALPSLRAIVDAGHQVVGVLTRPDAPAGRGRKLAASPVAALAESLDAVIGATLNTTGSLVIRADQVGSGTVLAQIVQLVASAQRSRAPMQRMADRVAFWFVLAVMAIAVATFLAWGLLF